MRFFLQHSLACAIASRLLAAQKNMRQTEQMFTAGLLHDLGRLILFIYFPEEALEVLRHAQHTSTCLYAAEKAPGLPPCPNREIPLEPMAPAAAAGEHGVLSS
jgi:HD-like signal output (HDOD) protein